MPDLAAIYANATKDAPPTQGAPDVQVTKEPNNVNPMTQQADVFFLDPALFEDGCKVGDEVMLKAKVTSKGSKVALTPLEIVAEAPEMEAEPMMGDNGQNTDTTN